ncbi:hypothetical protein Ancab_028026 [Ancistrocladus abbreviatus]
MAKISESTIVKATVNPSDFRSSMCKFKVELTSLLLGLRILYAVLDFGIQLVEAGVENDFVFALLVFCLQYVFVNHELWKYKDKHDRWMLTLKVSSAPLSYAYS